METLNVSNFGPVKSANVSLGDLTILVGPQASGKSLFLELFKLIKDRKYIVSDLRDYNYILTKANPDLVLDNYFGMGLHSLFHSDTEVECSGVKFNISNLTKMQSSSARTVESVFYVPAQRILSISDGRPKNFMEFDNTAPYVLRRFSETLRVFIQSGLGNPDTIFPMKNRLKGDVKRSISKSIFHTARVIIDQSTGQRKMVLDIDGMKLPFMTWSAGQKEFMPLLLALYCLTGPPTSVIDKVNYKWVIIEEPEMGLHPRAIKAIILEIMELIQAGYKVIISTHSSMFLEFAWTCASLDNLSRKDFGKALCELFDIGNDSTSANIFDNIHDKAIKTYFFAAKDNGVTVEDISSLDIDFSPEFENQWGGLSDFSNRVSDIVSKYYLPPSKP